MLWTALQDPDPVLIFEHQTLYNMEGDLPETAGAVDIDRAAVRRKGKDVSLITYGAALHTTMKAAQQLAGDGMDAEVIDLRTLRPLDMSTLEASLRKTRRAVIVDEGWRSGSLSAEIAARLAESLFYELDAPISRVCTAEVPIPYPKHLEAQVALVAFGKPVERPWVVDGRIEPRTVLTATVSVDRRAIDGRRAGQFLSAIDRGFQDPERL
jgi:pyruvate/2-oxoglutarate/acetoin dehydrogenase E1 component